MRKRFSIYLLLVIIFTLFNFYYRPISKNKLITKEYRKSSAYINDSYYSDEMFKKKLLRKDEYEVYEGIIKDISHGKPVSKFECKEDCVNTFYKIYYAIYLDHPEFIAFLGASVKTDGNVIDYQYDSMNNIRAALGARRIEREMDIIRRETKDMDDKEKIIYVYDYVASHQYDRIFTYAGSNQSAYSFFTKGSSVCAGFAKASQIIFQNIGIKSYSVIGESHMWNYVEYKGKYYVFDATMGASLYDKKSPGFYDGLGQTTVNTTIGLYSEYYPTIETTHLKTIFGLK